MPVITTTEFTVRAYECDAYGHLNNAHYLRYMQEAAFEASAAVGYPTDRYVQMGRLWLAHETEIEYLQPLYAGDTVEVRTWVADFRRVRSLRRYEFRRAGDDTLIAQATTDWAYLDSQTGRPVPVPDAVIAAYAGDDPIEQHPRQTFPVPPPAPPGAFTLHRQVEWRDIDGAHHLNNAAYLNYIEDCAIHAAAAHSWPMARWQAIGVAMVARSHRIVYHQPALLGEDLAITSWLFDARRFSAMRHYMIQRTSDDALVAQARTLWVAVSTDTHKPVRLPEGMLDDFAGHVAP